MTVRSSIRDTPRCPAALLAGGATLLCSLLLAACAPKPAASSASSSATPRDATAGASAPVAAGAVSTEFDPQDPMRNVRLVSEDRAVWMQLLRNHDKIRRTLLHRQEGDLGIVEAITESDDPAIAALIIDHGLSMQNRMKAGAQVRIWDPVFRELFERHELVELEVFVTDKGVRIVESSRDPETIALLRSHAMGVSDFVREGPPANRRETWRLPVGAPLPPSEVAIGGVPHRFLLMQPSVEQLSMLESFGVDRIVNFRKATEPGTYDEKAAAEAIEVEYCGLPYKEGEELTDELLLAARDEYRNAAANGTTLALHCRTGNRVGPGWAMYLALDRGFSVDEAIAAAKTVGMVDPLYESIVREAIRRQLAAKSGRSVSWAPVSPPLAADVDAQRVRAEESRDLMFARLLAALEEAMAAPGAEGKPAGPAAAIGVCKSQAPKIAQAVSREQGVMIGRTSDRLRNPSNVAPSWAAGLLSDRPVEARYVVNGDGSLGATLPIRLMPTCLACHGPADSIEPAVREALAAMYPKDQATGYAAGDLRGWFWVEVPPARTSS